MPLNSQLLGAALQNAANEYNDLTASTDDLPTIRQNFWKAVADEIINHIKANAVVNVNVATTGSAAAQTGTGTGTIQ